MAELQLIRWSDRGQEKQLKVIETIASKWKKLGITFGVPQSVLNGYEQEHRDQELRCYAVLQRWLEDGSTPKDNYPVSWNGLIKALNDSSLSVVADELKNALSKRTHC